MSGNSCTLGQLIDLAMEVEQKAYDFYAGLEEKFKNNEQFVSCVCGIKEDELLHYRILTEIQEALPEHRLTMPIPKEKVVPVQRVIKFLDTVDLDGMSDVDEVIDAIRTLEEVEFDVVMVFVDTEEIDFELTREYLKNESLDHNSRIYLAQQCLLD